MREWIFGKLKCVQMPKSRKMALFWWKTSSDSSSQIMVLVLWEGSCVRYKKSKRAHTVLTMREVTCPEGRGKGKLNDQTKMDVAYVFVLLSQYTRKSCNPILEGPYVMVQSL